MKLLEHTVKTNFTIVATGRLHIHNHSCNLCYKTYNLFGTFFYIICLSYTFFKGNDSILLH